LAIIKLDNLSKHYQVAEREAGLREAVKSLVARKYREIKAVDQISFEIEPGEVVGFLGPNGAGKTTTLKMLSGLLHPTHGSVSVLGYEPAKRAPGFLSQITLVMGNRNQLSWDLPALDSFELQRAIYAIPRGDFQRTVAEYLEILELKDLARKPIRNLSLGERMKMEIAGALLHRPKVLFLDEPTIGLDVIMQRRIRDFIAEYNRKYGATVLLTSHYMADVAALCKRVIVIHHGRLLVDDNLSVLVDRFSAYKTISVTLDDPDEDVSRFGEVIERSNGRVSLRIPKADASRVTAQILAETAASDLTVEAPPIEDVIEQVFATPDPGGK
jgi:ABC-2 type transport system ATP-binding protein